MKKLFFCIATVVMTSIAMGQAKPTKVAEKKSSTKKIEKVDNKTFKATKVSGASSYVATDYSYIDTGKTYQIYSHKISRGDRAGQTAYYIKKVSKKSG